MLQPLRFLPLLLALFLPTLLSAQDYQGVKAAQLVPGADEIRLAEKQSRPQYVHFDAAAPAIKSAAAFFQANLRLNADETLTQVSEKADRHGFTHTRYQQRFHGHRVVGGVYVAHARGGRLQSMGGELYDQFTGKTRATLSADDALNLALAEVPAETYAWEAGPGSIYDGKVQRPEPELVWVPKDLDFSTPFVLAYEVEITAASPLLRERLYLDARTGAVVARVNLIHETHEAHEPNHDCSAHPPVVDDRVGTAVTTLSGERQIVADELASGRFRLMDNARNVHTVNGLGAEDPEGLVDFFDDDNYWNNINPAGDEVATDIHWGAERYYDMLQELGRNSIDDNGTDLIGFAHLGQNEGNAFWNGFAAYFGDGNPEQRLNRPVVSIDIVGHEFTHGLVDYTAQLIYNGESGALNESFADIFGYMTNVFAKGVAESPWLIGAQSTSNGLGIRSFTNPNAYGHPKNYGGNLWFPGSGVHTNSSVQNHWFYLLANGGRGVNDFGERYNLRGVGRDTALSIAYRMLNVYLTESSNYADAAFYALRSAEDLYGGCSDIYREVNNAWYAVGLADEIAEEFVADFSAQRFYCDESATVNFRNQAGRVIAAEWDFGDGNTSTELNPTHTYDNAGSYTVTLRVEGCDDRLDTLTIVDYIVIDPNAASCAFTEMDVEMPLILTECEGSITDSGGPDGEYSNDELSSVTIEAPTSRSIVLDFSAFDLEDGFDFLQFYEGVANEGRFLGEYTGTELAGQSLDFAVNTLTMVLMTDAGVTGPGFVCTYRVSDGGRPANADFSANTRDLAFGQLLELDVTRRTVGRVDFYDMGDGTQVPNQSTTNQTTISHAYDAPGTYTVTQYVTSCTGQDSISRTITVAEPGTVLVAPDSINVTLNSGDTSAQVVTLQNVGTGPLLYNLTGGRSLEGPVVTGVLNTDATTTIEVSVRPSATAAFIPVNIAWPDGGAERTVVVTAEDGTRIIISEADQPGAEFVRGVLQLSGAAARSAFADGVVDVSITPGEMTDPADLSGTRYRVGTLVNGDNFIELPRDTSFARLPVGASVELPISINANGLNGGVYNSSVLVRTNDSLAIVTRIPITLTVVGEALLDVRTEEVDFGRAFVGFPDSAFVILTNSGTEALTIDELELSEVVGEDVSQLSLGEFPNRLAPGVRDTLIVYTNPIGAGFFAADLSIRTTGGDTIVPIFGQVDQPGSVAILPDTLRFIVANGESEPETLRIGNTGPGALNYDFSAEAVTEVLLWTGQDRPANRRSLLAALASQDRMVVNVTEFGVFNGAALTEALEDKDLFILPENGFIFAQTEVRQAILDFIERGGGLLVLRQPSVLNDLELGSFGPTALAAANLQVYAPEHPLAGGFRLPYETNTQTFGLNGSGDIAFENIIGTPRSAYVSASSFGDGRIAFLGASRFPAGDPVRNLLSNAIDYVAGDFADELFTFAPETGSVAADSEGEVTVSVEATTLPAGLNYVTLKGASDDPNQRALEIPVIIDVRTAPSAVIAIDYELACEGIISFSSVGEGNVDTYTWTFLDDDVTSNEAAPRYTFANSGVYAVDLEVCNEFGCNSTLSTLVINLEDPACNLLLMNDELNRMTRRCAGTLTDDGGADGNYSNNVTSKVTIAPEGVDAITFEVVSFNLERNRDFLTIYAGTEEDGERIGRYSNRDLESGELFTVASPVVTLVFTSDRGIVRAGFEINWGCGDGSLNADFRLAAQGDCGNQMAFYHTPSLMTDAIRWDFSDGQTSTEPNPVMLFGTSGEHTATLNAFGDGDTVTTTQTFDVTVPFNLAIDVVDTAFTNRVVRFRMETDVDLTSFFWELGDDLTSGSRRPRQTYTEAGVYPITLTGIDEQGCVMIDRKQLVVLTSVSTNYVAGGVEYQLFPNPVSEVATLKLTQPAGGGSTTVRLLDATGRQVLERSLGTSPRLETQLPVGELPAGIYVVQVLNQNGLLITDRLVVK